MRNKTLLAGLATLLVVTVGDATRQPEPLLAAEDVTITFDPDTTYQTMSGWEATLFAGQGLASFPQFKNSMFDKIVNEVGVNRVRLEVRAGVENTQPYWQQQADGDIPYSTWRGLRYSTVNDNADPDVIDPDGFHFEEMDWDVENLLLPIKSRVEANDEELHVSLCYISFTNQNVSGTDYHHDDPDEYAEFILATFQHLDTEYGIVPDTLELNLEPDNVPEWNGTVMGEALVATAARLDDAGYNPGFVGPSTTSMDRAKGYFDNLVAVDGAADLLTELSYHRYQGVSDANLRAIAQRAATYGIQTAQLEWMSGDLDDLVDDLSIGMNSSWAHFTINGNPATRGDYLYVDESSGSPVVKIGDQTRFYRQYFKWVRRDAVRVGATSTHSSQQPMAFVNADDRPVVVVRTTSAGSFNVEGLPAGFYGINYSTASAYDVDLSDVRIADGESIAAAIPAAGVITVYARSLDVAPPPPPPPPPVDDRIPVDPNDPPPSLQVPADDTGCKRVLEFSIDEAFAGAVRKLKIKKDRTAVVPKARVWKKIAKLGIGIEGETIYERIRCKKHGTVEDLDGLYLRDAQAPTVFSPAADATLGRTPPEFSFDAGGAPRAWFEVAADAAFEDVAGKLRFRKSPSTPSKKSWRRIVRKLNALGAEGTGYVRAVARDAIGRTAASDPTAFTYSDN